jgi:nucleotide-binding universal stress UspA family protein
MSRVRRILYPTDFSKGSGAALARAVQLAKADRAQLLIVHVLAPVVPIAGEGYISPQVYEDIETSGRKHAQRRLSALQAKAKKAGVRATTLLLEGVAHEQIIRAAKSKKADLIVMGTHGHTGIVRFFLGSVTSRVIAGAPCPVLSVRGR